MGVLGGARPPQAEFGSAMCVCAMCVCVVPMVTPVALWFVGELDERAGRGTPRIMPWYNDCDDGCSRYGQGGYGKGKGKHFAEKKSPY